MAVPQGQVSASEKSEPAFDIDEQDGLVEYSAEEVRMRYQLAALSGTNCAIAHRFVSARREKCYLGKHFLQKRFKR